MSTVAEASMAHASGLRVAALACIANPAAGLSAEVLRHEDVLHRMQRSCERLRLLLEGALPAWQALLG
jgi:purine nucleoside phosphorylase